MTPERHAEILADDERAIYNRPGGHLALAPFTAEGQRHELLTEVQRLADELDELKDLGIERHAEMLVDEVRLRSLEIRNGGFKMEMEEARDLAAIYVACARTMLGDAENYTETPISFHVKVAEQPELYILTVQRTEPHKLTPHQARQHAETERDQALAGHRKMRETLRSVAEELEELPEICRNLVGPRCGEAVDRAREARRLADELDAREASSDQAATREIDLRAERDEARSQVGDIFGVNHGIRYAKALNRAERHECLDAWRTRDDSIRIALGIAIDGTSTTPNTPEDPS